MSPWKSAHCSTLAVAVILATLIGCRADKNDVQLAQPTVEKPAAPEKETMIPEINPADAKKLLDENKGYVYLDVRSVAEFEAGHAPGAINIPIAEPNAATGQMEPNPDFLPVVEATIPRDAKLIVGCKSGGRSFRACGMLLRAGYTHPQNMVGGFIGAADPSGAVIKKGWSALGYPVEKGDGGEGSYNKLRRQKP